MGLPLWNTRLGGRLQPAAFTTATFPTTPPGEAGPVAGSLLFGGASASPPSTLTLANVTTSDTPNNVTSLTASHYLEAGVNLLVAFVSYADTASNSISGVTWNGSAMTKLAGSASASSATGRGVEAWYMASPTPLSTYGEVKVTQAISTSVAIHVLSYWNADTTTPFTSVGTNSGTGTSATATAGGAGNLVLGAVAVRSLTTLTPSGTLVGRNAKSDNCMSTVSTQAGTSWSASWGTSDNWASLSFGVNQGATAKTIDASGTGTATGTAAVNKTVSIDASATATGTGTAGIGLQQSIAAAATATGTGTAAIQSAKTIAATATGTATGTAAVSHTAPVAATATVTATGTAGIARSTSITATGSATGTGTAGVARTADITASATATGAGTADVARVVSITASATATATGTADITVAATGSTVTVAASGAAAASATATLDVPTRVRIRFTTPSRDELDIGRPYDLWFVGRPTKGYTLLREGGVWSMVGSVQQSRIDAAEYAYRGGYVYWIDFGPALDLYRAGFGAGLTDPFGDMIQGEYV